MIYYFIVLCTWIGAIFVQWFCTFRKEFSIEVNNKEKRKSPLMVFLLYYIIVTILIILVEGYMNGKSVGIVLISIVGNILGSSFFSSGIMSLYIIRICTLKIPAIYVKTRFVSDTSTKPQTTIGSVLPTFYYSYNGVDYEGESKALVDQPVICTKMRKGDMTEILIHPNYPWVYICNKDGKWEKIGEVVLGIIVFVLTVVPPVGALYG